MLIILLRLLNALQILHFIFSKNVQNYEVIIVHRLDFSPCPSFSWDHGTHGEKKSKSLGRVNWAGPASIQPPGRPRASHSICMGKGLCSRRSVPFPRRSQHTGSPAGHKEPHRPVSQIPAHHKTFL